MSAADSKYVWIRTQDGSPTLWSNEIGEPFRSVKGAFHESLIVFVKPALAFAQSQTWSRPLVVAEFGLGAGTNWVFFSAAAKALKIPFQYYAIERDVEAFELALDKWNEESALLNEMLAKHLGLQTHVQVADLEAPTIYPSLDLCVTSLAEQKLKADIWFHDPFGAGVNPEGYSDETLKTCSQVWGQPMVGLSYACNGAFQRSLKALGMNTQVNELNSPPLKRESLSFFLDAERKLTYIPPRDE